jgi:[acyl-carrier-protein] S-malonyltransferase
MHKSGTVFPGQGSQYIGMGRDLFEQFEEARHVFDEAEEVLKSNIKRLCFEGPQEALDLTVNTQTCLLTVSIAAYRVFEKEIAIKPAAMAGHSLGEYSALCAAGTFGFADALRLVHARANCQQDAVPKGKGCMAAIIGTDRESIERICGNISSDNEVVELANINSPNQFVISGHTGAVEKALEKAKEAGAKRGIKLPISIPSHCSLLADAATKFGGYLEGIEIKDCATHVIPNCNPKMLHSEKSTRNLLQRQLYSPVRWQETVEEMARMGIDTILEIGPKSVLSGLIKRIDRNIRTFNIEDTDSLKKTAEALKDN